RRDSRSARNDSIGRREADARGLARHRNAGGGRAQKQRMRIGVRYRRRGMLDRILIPKRAEIARMLAGPPLPPERHAGGGVAEALQRPSGAPLRLIAEVKFRSPSAGVLSTRLGARERARCYA